MSTEAAASILVAQAVAQGKGETVTDPDILRRVSEIVEEVNHRAATLGGDTLSSRGRAA